MKATAENYELFKRWIKYRIKQNKNVLIITVGSTGSGKSFSNLRILEDVDSSFNVNMVAFEPEQFMAITDSGILKRKGAGILYDDAGITLSSRNWYDITNKMINYYLQIARSENQILAFNTPEMSFLDSGARKLFHMILITVGIDYKRKVVKLKPKFLQINKTTGKVYAKYIIVKKGTGYGSKKKIRMIEVPMPSPKLVKAYEAKKKVFVRGLKKQIIEGIRMKNLKEMTDKQFLVYKAKKAGISEEEIAKSMGISKSTVYKHKEALKKKGYDLKNG